MDYYLKNKNTAAGAGTGAPALDKASFMQALTSAVSHIHGLGWAHNDIHPANIIMLDEQRSPVLIDLGSARKIGQRWRRFASGWMRRLMVELEMVKR